MSHRISRHELLPVALLVVLLVGCLAVPDPATAMESQPDPPPTAAETPAAGSADPDVAALNCCYYLKNVETPGNKACGELCDITVLGPQRFCPISLTCDGGPGRQVKVHCLTLPPDGDVCPDLDDDEIETCREVDLVTCP